MSKNKLTADKVAYTIHGAVVIVKDVIGAKVTVIDQLFGDDMVLAIDEVYHSRNKAWGRREV